jgi:hypothetical protein
MRDGRIEAFTLVDQAMRIQLTDDGDVAEAESRLLRALELDPGSVEALQEAAHFYAVVMPDLRRSQVYAAACREGAAKIVAEMDVILGSLEDEVWTSRCNPPAATSVVAAVTHPIPARTSRTTTGRQQDRPWAVLHGPPCDRWGTVERAAAVRRV